MSRLFVLILALVLAGCGGGGGGGAASAPPAATDTPAGAQPVAPAVARTDIVISPDALSLITYEGEYNSLFLQVKPTSPTLLQSVALVQLQDPDSVIMNAVLDRLSNPPVVQILVNNALKPGTYDGMLTALLCLKRDDECAAQAAPPITMPYHILVRSSASNLTPLSALSGAADWDAYQGSIAHTGFVPVDLDPTKFTRRFVYAAPGAAGRDITTGGSNVTYVAYDNGFDNGTLLANGSVLAVKEASGTLAWSAPASGARGSVSSAGAVYNGTIGKVLIGRDRESGALVKRFPGATLGPDLEAASAIDGGVLYGADIFNLASGVSTPIQGRGTSVPAYGNPTVDGAYMYVYDGSGIDRDRVLLTVNKQTGQRVSADTTVQPRTSATFPQGTVVSRCNPTTLLVSGGIELVAYDTSSHAVRWSVSRGATGLACNQTSVYVQTDSGVEQRSLADGKVDWAWSGMQDMNKGFTPRGIGSSAGANLVLTNRHLFVPGRMLVALDLVTHQVVWADQTAATRLAVSRNGVLYAIDGGTLTAVNLK